MLTLSFRVNIDPASAALLAVNVDELRQARPSAETDLVRVENEVRPNWFLFRVPIVVRAACRAEKTVVLSLMSFETWTQSRMRIRRKAAVTNGNGARTHELRTRRLSDIHSHTWTIVRYPLVPRAHRYADSATRRR